MPPSIPLGQKDPEKAQNLVNDSEVEPYQRYNNHFSGIFLDGFLEIINLGDRGNR